MSILAQIMKDMYIDPDLLAELSEEQKQLLFCKLREEQVRRWTEHEKKKEHEEAKKKKKKLPKAASSKNKTVIFLSGVDNKEWVWVMGEHKNDMTIDVIIEEEAKLQAAKQAEVDALRLREMEEAEVRRQMKAEEERLDKEIEEKETVAKKKAEEAAIYQSLKEARLAAEKMEIEKMELERKEKEELARIQKKKRQSVHTLEELKSQRKNDLYKTWKQLRASMEQDALESSRIVEEEWNIQEKKSKEAERKIRELARKARAEHRKSSAYILSGTKSLPSFANKTMAPAPPLPQKICKNSINKVKCSAPRPPRPTSKDSVIRWFRDEELPKGMGTNSETGKPEVWFHGIISRGEAEDLLEPSSVGTFLVRVSEKIWGYTITYKEETRCKHFLVDAADGKYHFFGTDQMKHSSLKDLINHHKKTPISLEHEILMNACGQQRDPPDYHELFSSQRSESTCL